MEGVCAAYACQNFIEQHLLPCPSRHLPNPGWKLYQKFRLVCGVCIKLSLWFVVSWMSGPMCFASVPDTLVVTDNFAVHVELCMISFCSYLLRFFTLCLFLVFFSRHPFKVPFLQSFFLQETFTVDKKQKHYFMETKVLINGLEETVQTLILGYQPENPYVSYPKTSFSLISQNNL